MSEINEETIEAIYWEFDAERSRTGMERDAFKHKLRAALRRTAPQGHYEEIGGEIGRLVDRKQKAYGRSFDHVGKILAILYPAGIHPEQYDDLGGMIRILDKFFRIATQKRAFGENPWKDVAGYGLLMNRELLIQAAWPDYPAVPDPPPFDCRPPDSPDKVGPPGVAADKAAFLAPFKKEN